MDSHSPESDVHRGFEGLLMDGNLLQIVQCLPPVNHPEREGAKLQKFPGQSSTVLDFEDRLLHGDYFRAVILTVSIPYTEGKNV